MGISVRCQDLSEVVDELFADFKDQFVFNFLDDLVVYSSSAEEHVGHVHEVLNILQKSVFTRDPDKVVLDASELRYSEHLLSAPKRVAAIQKYPRPSNLGSFRRFIGMVGFYARFIPGYANIVAVLHEMKKKGIVFVWEEQHQAAFES